MSTFAAPAGEATPAPSSRRRARAWTLASPQLSLELITYLCLAAFTALQYGGLVEHPPGLRLLGLAGVATAAAGLLALSRRAGPARLALAALALVAALGAQLLVLDVPAHLLAPAHWDTLVMHVRHGYKGLQDWLWPYRGVSRWSRLTVLIVLPVTFTLATGLCFWPSSRWLRGRRLLGLGLLVAAFAAGAANESSSLWRLQGAVLLVALMAWLTLPTLPGGELTRALRWLAGAVAAGLVLAPLIHSRHAWIDDSGWNPIESTTAFQWDQLYGPNAWSLASTPMLEVNELKPPLLQVTTLDRFDGLRFLRSDHQPGGISLELPGTHEPGSWFQVAIITVRGLRSAPLADGGGTALQTRWLSGASGSVRLEPDGTLAATAAPGAGARYTVTSYDPTPSPARLRSVPRAFPAAYLPYTQLTLPSPHASGLKTPDLAAEARARQLPGKLVGPTRPGLTPAADPAVAAAIDASPYARALTLAQALASGTRSSYEVVEHVERYLRGNYIYDLHPARARYPLLSFLFRTRRGYCQQFSGAMALLLRLDGIPARIAVGFQPGVHEGFSTRWQVQARNAHSWVQVYFRGIGWVTFDPTPPTATRLAGLNGGDLSALSSKATIQGRQSKHTHHNHASAKTTAGAAAAGAGGGGGQSSGLLLSLAGGLALVALALGALWARSWRRLQRAYADPSGAALLAELRGALVALGLSIETNTTLAQLRRRLALEGRGDAVRYAELLSERRFRGGPGPRAGDRRRLRHALAAGGIRRRLRVLWVLPPAGLGPGAGRRAQAVSSAAISSNTAT